MEDGDHLIMGVLSLVHYPVHAPLASLPVLEIDTAQGPTHLHQDEGVTTRLPQVEGNQTTHGHQEVLEESEMLIKAGLILQVTVMLLIKMKMAMGIARNQHMRPRNHVVTGGPRLVEPQDHPLDPGLGLRTCHPGAADKGKGKAR